MCIVPLPSGKSVLDSPNKTVEKHAIPCYSAHARYFAPGDSLRSVTPAQGSTPGTSATFASLLKSRARVSPSSSTFAVIGLPPSPQPGPGVSRKTSPGLGTMRFPSP
jgi:hypothetical protein